MKYYYYEPWNDLTIEYKRDDLGDKYILIEDDDEQLIFDFEKGLI